MAAMRYDDYYVWLRATSASRDEVVIRVSALDKWDAMRLASDKFQREHDLSDDFCSGVALVTA
jgi:hypothetical protein